MTLLELNKKVDTVERYLANNSEGKNGKDPRYNRMKGWAQGVHDALKTVLTELGANNDH